MLLMDEIVTINFEHLSDLEITFGEKISINVYLDDIYYEFILNLKKSSDKLLIMGLEPEGFSNGDRSKPYFEKYGWEFEHSTIFYNDPTYFIDESITAGLCIGTENNYYLENIIKILKILINKLDVSAESILFYGSSVGGFTSLLLSTYFKNSISLSDNPILYAYNFESNEIELGNFESVKKHCFSDMSLELFIEKFNKRLSFIETMKQENYVPSVYLILNYANYSPQFLQFFKDLAQLNDSIYSNKINLIIYWDSNNSVLNKDETINLINDIFLNNSVDKIEKRLNEKFSKDNILNFSQESILKLLKYNTARIDLKFEGNVNNKINILDVSDGTEIRMPFWLNETGGDGIIFLNKSNSIDIKIRCIGTGELFIRLRGVDFRDKFDNRIPIYINYSKFSINGVELLKENELTWHDEPFIHIETIELSNILDIHIEWSAC